MAIKYCPHCGKENVDNSNFCGACGTDLRDVQQPQPVNQAYGDPYYNQYGQPQEYYEEVAHLRRKSPAYLIVGLAIVVGVVVPGLFTISGTGYQLGIRYNQWFLYWFTLIFAFLELLVIEPLTFTFGMIRLCKLNSYASKPIIYYPSRNTFAFFRGNSKLEIYAKNIVSFNGFGFLKVYYYDEFGPNNAVIGWASCDVVEALQAKLEQAKQSYI